MKRFRLTRKRDTGCKCNPMTTMRVTMFLTALPTMRLWLTFKIQLILEFKVTLWEFFAFFCEITSCFFSPDIKKETVKKHFGAQRNPEAEDINGNFLRIDFSNDSSTGLDWNGNASRQHKNQQCKRIINKLSISFSEMFLLENRETSGQSLDGATEYEIAQHINLNIPFLVSRHGNRKKRTSLSLSDRENYCTPLFIRCSWCCRQVWPPVPNWKWIWCEAIIFIQIIFPCALFFSILVKRSILSCKIEI